MRWLLKKLSTGGGEAKGNGARGNGVWGTIQISSWKCNYRIYLDIQVYYMDIQPISTLLCLLGCWCASINFSIIHVIKNAPEKWHFWSLQSLLLSQFSTYSHRTGCIMKRKQVCITNYLGIPINCLKKKSMFLFC